MLDLDGNPQPLVARTDDSEMEVTIGADGFSYTRKGDEAQGLQARQHPLSAGVLERHPVVVASCSGYVRFAAASTWEIERGETPGGADDV